MNKMPCTTEVMSSLKETKSDPRVIPNNEFSHNTRKLNKIRKKYQEDVYQCAYILGNNFVLAALKLTTRSVLINRN